MNDADAHTDEALDRLLESFDTTYLLRMVDMIDDIGARTGDPSGLRDDLLRFHTLAHRILNEGPSSPSLESLQDLASGACDLGRELGEWAERLREAGDWFESLTTAIPLED